MLVENSWEQHAEVFVHRKAERFDVVFRSVWPMLDPREQASNRSTDPVCFAVTLGPWGLSSMEIQGQFLPRDWKANR